MFNTRINNGYQNTNDPNMGMDENGYRTMPQAPYASFNPQDPYAIYNQDPSMMQNIPYPMPPAETNTAYPQGYNPTGYAKGGKVKKSKGGGQNSPYPMLAEMIREQGEGEDTILAHINPLEAMMLKAMGGSGTINKKTGLPQFSWFTNPKKATKSFFTKPKRALAEIVGLGSMILGGPLGGAMGGAAKEAILGRSKNMLSGALSGAMGGSLIPGAARLIGGGLGSLGATGAGGFLENYGKANMGSWMGNMGKVGNGISGMFGIDGAGEALGGSASQASSPNNFLTSSMLSGSSPNLSLAGGETAAGVAKAGSGSAPESWYNQLLGNSKSFLSKPKNLLTAGVLASSMLNRPKQEKPKTPEQIASEQKRLEKALMLSPEERSAKEAELVAEAKMYRSVARNKFLPDDRIYNLEPLHRKSHTPEEYKKYGKWFSYHNNPDFSGEPIPFAKGGMYPEQMVYEAEETTSPSLGNYIMGHSKGQDDDVNAKLSNGEFVIPADIVADLGDGNNNAGANVLYGLMTNVRKHKRGGKVKLPPKAKPLASYLKK